MAPSVAIGNISAHVTVCCSASDGRTPKSPPTTKSPTVAAKTELKVARTLVSLGLFSAVALFAGAMTVSGLSFTADTVAKVAASTVKTQKLKPSYIAYMPEMNTEAPTVKMRAEALNIAKSVAVTQVVSNKSPGPPVASPAPSFTHTVAVNSLRVRSGPRKTTPQIFVLKGGTQVTVIKDEGSWVLISAGGDRIGWVYSKMLRPAERLQAQN